MTTSVSNGISVSEIPMALKSNPPARRCWLSAVESRINGWGLIEAEIHRVTAIKGDSLVHFAPVGSDFNNPVALSPAQKASALQTAKEWCRANSCAVTKDFTLESIHEEIKKTVRAISALRKNVLEAQSLDDKILANDRMKAQQALLSNQRLNIFAAEDAVDDCIRSLSMEPFEKLAQLFPAVASLIEQLLKRQPVLATSA